MDLIGRTLGQYHITEQIGQGGMATVYKAYQPNLERFVAIKVLASHHGRVAGFKERFFREARAVAQLSHPNILPVYDVGMDNDICYLVMKCIKGRSLRELIGEQMSLSQVSKYIDQIAAALDHAHEQGVIHRDIKTSNLLVEGEWVFLMDFGIAKIREASMALTGTGELLGTPCYMSPEQASGKPVDHRTDIYSLGVVLYEMVTGTIPFKGETPYGVIYQLINNPLPLPRQHRPDLPKKVENVIFKSLAKNPDHRFSTAGQLAAALREALAPEPVKVFKSSEDSTVRTPAKGVPPVGSPGNRAGPQHSAPGPVYSASQSNRTILVLGIGLILVLAGALFTYLIIVGNGPILPSIPSARVDRAPPFQPRPATLQVETNPKGATIKVDGVLKGSSPAALDVEPGEHRLRVELPGHQAWEEMLRLVDPKVYPVKIDLMPITRAATVRIESAPAGAEVSVDGVSKGKTPFESQLPLGSYSVRVGLSGYKESQRVLKVSEAKEYQLLVELTRMDAPEVPPPAQGQEGAADLDTYFDKGRQLFESKNYSEAYELFMKSAGQGHAESQNEVGYMTMHGLGVKKDLKSAAAWLRKAAAQGNAASQNNLGILYLRGGPGIQQDDREAFNWFRLAAEQGNRDGQFYVGNMYRYGRGQSEDSEQAAEWFRKAAAQGHEGAAKALKALGK
jgi:serine/threonine protein kinase/tetratricopeptide (TPR) repeat protein